MWDSSTSTWEHLFQLFISHSFAEAKRNEQNFVSFETPPSLNLPRTKARTTGFNSQTLAFGPVIGLGMRAKAPAVAKENEEDGKMTGVWRWFSFRLGFGMFPVLKFLPVVARNFVYRKLLGWVSVLPQNPSIAINIASSSCSRTCDHSVRRWTGRFGNFTCFEKKGRWCCMVCLLGKVQAVILDRRVSVLSQNPSIAIDIASSSCSRTWQQCSLVNWSSWKVYLFWI